MKTGIIGAMEPEIEILTAKLQNQRCEHRAWADFYCGTISGQEIVIVRSGIGKVCAGGVTALLISDFGVDCIINTGCAGAVSKELKIGDTVFSTRAACHDADLTVFGYKKGQMADQPQFFDADPGLIAQAERAAADLPSFKGHIRKGTVISGDQFISDRNKRQELTTMFPDALVTEMEGAAVAQVACNCKVPFLIVRAVSDCAYEGDPMTYEEFLPLAAQNCASLILKMLALQAP